MNQDYQKFYRDENVLITGGLGFIGSNLAMRLIELGANVTVLDAKVPDTGFNDFNIDPIQGQVEVIIGDIADPGKLAQAIPGKKYIFNLAGLLSHTDSMLDPIRDLHSNCIGQIQLLEYCRKHNPEVRLLFAGTRGQYGKPAQDPVNEKTLIRPIDVNGINKTAGEAYHLLYSDYYGLFATSLRLANTYGPRHQMRHHRQGILNWFIRKVIDRDPVPIFGDGSQIRDTNYVQDVVQAMVMTIVQDCARGEIYNLGGFPISLAQAAHLMVEVEGKGRVEFMEYTEESKKIEVGNYIADIHKISQQIGWRPVTDPREGFMQTLDYYREYKSKYWD